MKVMPEADAIKMACAQPTLVEALSWIAVWECQQAAVKYHTYCVTGVHQGGNGEGYDTHFKWYFDRIIQSYLCITHDKREVPNENAPREDQ
jgi:hypothetical protein